MASFRGVSRSGHREETTMDISGFSSLYFKVGKILENRFKTKMNYARIKYGTSNPIEKVACVLNAFLIYEHKKHGNVFNYMKTICDENEVKLSDDNRYWIYDSRKHDKLPKNTQEIPSRFFSLRRAVPRRVFCGPCCPRDHNPRLFRVPTG